MEIRDPVHGTLILSDAETAIIDTPEYQRLRWIRQLGFSEFAYPAATHNRYLHSLGVCHLAGLAFDQIFSKSSGGSGVSGPALGTLAAHGLPQHKKAAFRQALKLGALLHDVGHGPLSHVIEEVMPDFRKLNLSLLPQVERKATHEDYTLKFITDSPLTEVLRANFPDFQPLHVACLMDPSIEAPDDFFFHQGLNFRPVLSQLVSSELDCDRMDYLERDSYFCGTNYGKFDLYWMLGNLTVHVHEDKAHLAINRRALYTFDDFLISRHHMHLMVYFHHKSIIYEEMLGRYLTSKECSFFLPPEILDYTHYTDNRLYEHLKTATNPWAKRISERKPYRVLIELHNASGNSSQVGGTNLNNGNAGSATSAQNRASYIHSELEKNNFASIFTSSHTRLSKYHASMTSSGDTRAAPIFVIDHYDPWDTPAPLHESTEIFQRYEGTRIIERIYVEPESYPQAEKFLKQTLKNRELK